MWHLVPSFFRPSLQQKLTLISVPPSDSYISFRHNPRINQIYVYAKTTAVLIIAREICWHAYTEGGPDTIIIIDSVTLYAVGIQSAIIRPVNAALLTLIMHQAGDGGGRSSKLTVSFDTICAGRALLTDAGEPLIISSAVVWRYNTLSSLSDIRRKNLTRNCNDF